MRDTCAADDSWHGYRQRISRTLPGSLVQPQGVTDAQEGIRCAQFWGGLQPQPTVHSGAQAGC